MKLDLKINYSKLDTIHNYTVVYIHALSDAADAIQKVQKELRKQDSKTVDALYNMGERILKRYKEMISALEDIKKSVKTYNSSMYEIIAPKNEDADMRIDFLDLAGNVATIKARALQFLDIPVDMDGNCLDVTIGDPKKVAVAAGMIVMAAIDEVTNQEKGYFQTLLDIKINKMPACAMEINNETKRLDKILKAALEFQAKDVYYSGLTDMMYYKYTNAIEFYADWAVNAVKMLVAQAEGAWNAVADFFVGIGAIIINYTIPAELVYLVTVKPSEWSIEGLTKPNPMTEALKGYLNDPLSLVENISQQATDTLDKKGAAYCAAYVVTDLIGIELALGKIGKLGKTVAKSDEIVDVVSKVDDVGNGSSKLDEVASINSELISDVSQLNADEIEALVKYSGNDYKNINDSLRGIDNMTEANKNTANALKNVLDKARLSKDMTLYRGTSTEALGDLKTLSPEDLVGGKIIENGFMSTSTNNAVASGTFSGNMQMTIEAPMGSKGLDISSISQYANESEVLFQSGSEMIITKATKINDILYITVRLIN